MASAERARDAAPVLVETWNGLAPPPSWKQRLDQCYARLQESAFSAL